MSRLALAAATAAAIIAGVPAAQAQGAPYCISGDTAGGGNSIYSCIYMSFRQCQHTVRDTGRSCVRNPRMAYGYAPIEDSYAMDPAYGGSVYVYEAPPAVRYIDPSDY